MGTPSSAHSITCLTCLCRDSSECACCHGSSDRQFCNCWRSV